MEKLRVLLIGAAFSADVEASLQQLAELSGIALPVEA